MNRSRCPWWCLSASEQRAVAVLVFVGWGLLALSAAGRGGLFLGLQGERHPRPAADVQEEASGEVDRLPRVGSSRPRPLLQLDLNRATEVQLMQLPGVGPTLARRIVQYRRQHGAFASVEELIRVRGIGPRRLKRLRPYLVVGTQEGELSARAEE